MRPFSVWAGDIELCKECFLRDNEKLVTIVGIVQTFWIYTITKFSLFSLIRPSSSLVFTVHEASIFLYFNPHSVVCLLRFRIVSASLQIWLNIRAFPPILGNSSSYVYDFAPSPFCLYFHKHEENFPQFYQCVHRYSGGVNIPILEGRSDILNKIIRVFSTNTSCCLHTFHSCMGNNTVVISVRHSYAITVAKFGSTLPVHLQKNRKFNIAFYLKYKK